MSQIIESKYDTENILNYLEKLRSNGYTKDILDEILNSIIPKNDMVQIKGIIDKSDNSYHPAFFDPNIKSIKIYPEQLESFILKLIHPTLKVFPHFDKKEIFNYYVIYTLIHEIEHVYQYLISKGYIDFPYKIVIEAYKELGGLKIYKNDNIIYSLLKYYSHFKQTQKPGFLLERNANVEAYILLRKIATFENNIDFQKFIEFQLSFQLMYGYKGLFNGAVEESYKRTMRNSLYKTLPKDEDISQEDRVRYELPIDKETRKKVLRKEFKI